MAKVQAGRETEKVVLFRDGSVDSALTKSAASMLESVETYLAAHPEISGFVRIPARSERGTAPTVKMEA